MLLLHIYLLDVLVIYALELVNRLVSKTPYDIVSDMCLVLNTELPDSKVYGANMGPTWVLSPPDGLHVGPMNLALRAVIHFTTCKTVSQDSCRFTTFYYEDLRWV